MLFALGQPVALAGLLAAFVVAVAVRAAVGNAVRSRRGESRRDGSRALGRMRLLDVRRDVDVFGFVGAVLGGTGWGSPLPDVGTRPAPVAALLAGPLAVIGTSQAALAAHAVAGGSPLPLRAYGAADILRGLPAGVGVDALSQALVSFAVGLLAFGVLALLPLPPLDGWGLLRHTVRRPGTGFQRARYWLEDQNIGTVILLVGLVLPLGRGTPLLLVLLDAVTLPVLRAWG